MSGRSSAPSLSDLPTLEQTLPALLRRAQGFAFLICTAPSRGAMADAAREVTSLTKEAGRQVGASIRSATSGQVVIGSVDGASPAERQTQALRHNVARDFLGAKGVVLVLLLLDDDYPNFSALCPDLWTVRYSVARHTEPTPFAAPAPRPTPLPRRVEVPAALRDLAAHIPLQLLRLERHGQGSSRRVTMDDLFVDLDLAGPALPPESNGDATIGPAVPQLTRYRSALLEGPPGSGKSTLLRRYARARTAAGDAVILLSARDLTDAPIGLHDLPASLQKLRACCPWPVPEGTPHLVVDGLDEVPTADRQQALLLLADDLVRAGLVASMVVSSRPKGGLPGAEPRTPDAVPRLALLELDPPRARTYVERWTTLVAASPKERKEEQARLLRTLGINDRRVGGPTPLSELCRRPMFLAVLCALVWGSGKQPSGMHELLDALIDALVSGRPSADYRPADLRWLASKVAWVMDQRRVYGLSAAELVEGEEPTLSARHLQALRLHSELLTDDGDQVAFVHPAIQDALAAERAPPRPPPPP